MAKVLFSMIYPSGEGGSGAPVYTEIVLRDLVDSLLQPGIIYTTDDEHKINPELPYAQHPVRLEKPPIFDSQPTVRNSVAFRDLSQLEVDEMQESVYTETLKALNTHEYDLIHVQHGMYLGYIAALVQRERGVPYIVTLHMMELAFLEEFPDPIEAFIAMAEAKYIIAYTEVQKQRLLDEYDPERVIKLHAKAKDIPIKAAREEFVRKTNVDTIDPSRVVYCPLGINLSKFTLLSKDDCNDLHSKLNIPYDKKVVLFAGRVIRQKGIVDLLEAEALYNANDDVITIIVGGGDLEQLVKDTALKRKNIRYLGFQDRDDMPLLLNYVSHHPSVFVAPSQFEGFGFVYLEAMACGLKAIAGARKEISCLDFMQPPYAQFTEFGKPTVLAELIKQELSISVDRESINANIQKYSTEEMCRLVNVFYEMVTKEQSQHNRPKTIESVAS